MSTQGSQHLNVPYEFRESLEKSSSIECILVFKVGGRADHAPATLRGPGVHRLRERCLVATLVVVLVRDVAGTATLRISMSDSGC